MTTMKVKVTTTEPMLGSSPASPDIYSDFIASKTAEPEKRLEELKEMFGEEYEEAMFEDMYPKNLTVFGRHNGHPFVWDYQWKGLFKDACSMLRRVTGTESSKCKAFKKIIDGLIFVDERKIPVETNEEVTVCERPLRASTAQGERVALAASESIAPGATMTFTIRCFVDSDAKMVKEWLDYGQYRGFGQWRNSGCGRFTWELLEEKVA